MCRFALDHIRNPEVKQITEMLIEEHTQCSEKLAQFAPEAASMKFDGSAKNRRTSRLRKARSDRPPVGITQNRSGTPIRPLMPGKTTSRLPATVCF